MKTIGDKLTAFAVTGVKPGQPADPYFTITDQSFEGKWKVIVYYPKDFTFVCPTEIVAYDKLAGDFADRDAVLLTGSTDNEFCKVSWQNAHADLKKITHHQFADTQRGELSLRERARRRAGDDELQHPEAFACQRGDRVYHLCRAGWRRE